LDGTQIEARGKVIYLKKSANHKNYVGVKFVGNDSETITFVKELVKNYHRKKF
jgi:hypothetical protein